MNNCRLSEHEMELEGILARNHQTACHGNYDIEMPPVPGYYKYKFAEWLYNVK